MEPLSLYLHIPFCTVKCPYCDFNTYSRIEGLIPAYLDAFQREIRRWGSEVGRGYQVQTIFFGGGTPSLLTEEQVCSLLETCHKSFLVAEDTEISLEANPETVTEDYMRGLLQAGVNRLSMGAQSFDEAELKWLGRTHGSETIIMAYEAARAAGFENISLDLIYGLTGQSASTWERTLRRAIQLRPDHLSLYALTIEEGTPFGRQAARGQLKQPDPDAAADMYLLAAEALEAEGYTHYEISNWEFGGHACRHNTTYWEDRQYLGFGPGAHSYFGGYRFSDIRSPRKYIERLDHSTGADRDAEQGTPGLSNEESIRRLSPIDMMEHIDRDMEMSETMVLGLRLVKGVSKERFKTRFGAAIEEIYGDVIEELKSLALLEEAEGHVRLTPRGWLLSNEAFVRFL